MVIDKDFLHFTFHKYDRGIPVPFTAQVMEYAGHSNSVPCQTVAPNTSNFEHYGYYVSEWPLICTVMSIYFLDDSSYWALLNKSDLDKCSPRR